jgi:hypothetical protein
MERRTLLVGLVGSDGIVITADQREAGFATSEEEIDDLMDGRKIEDFAEHRIACGYCGDSFSVGIGAEIRAMAEDGSFSDIAASLRSAGERGMRKSYERARNPYDVRD